MLSSGSASAAAETKRFCLIFSQLATEKNYELVGLYSVHEQHIRAASCRSRLESQWETPNFDPRGAKTSGGIELKIGRINYLGGLTKGAKFQICNPPGVVWAIG